MDDTDNALRRYFEVAPDTFSILARLELHQEIPADGEPPRITARIELLPTDDSDRRILVLTFNGIARLRLKCDSSLIELTALDITSIRPDQWEGLNYKVADCEGETLSFYCRDFDVALTHDS